MFVGINVVIDGEVVLAVKQAGATTDDLFELDHGVVVSQEHDVANVAGIDTGGQLLGRGEDGGDGLLVILERSQILFSQCAVVGRDPMAVIRVGAGFHLVDEIPGNQGVILGGAKHQGCVLQIVESSPNALTLDQLLQQNHNRSLYLVLDGVQDPHNLGACLRTADATGVDAVIIPKDRSAGLSATVRKVAAGGAESVPLLEVTNIARSLKEMKKAGIWIYGTSGEAIADVYQYSYDSAVALVMRAEGDGLRRLTAEQCDHLVKLPMLGTVESLNVSVATGVCLYEILRSRMSCS